MAPRELGEGQQGEGQQQTIRQEDHAAFMIVDERGTVVRASGWEKTFGVPAPERIATAENAHDRLLACLVEAIDEAGTTGGLARRTAHLGDPPHRVEVAAASLAGTGGGASTVIVVQPRGEAAGGRPGDEGKMIRKLEHDLRSPLTSISGAAELLESTRLGQINDQQMKCLGVIQKGVDVMVGLLESAAAPYRQARALRNAPLAPPDDEEQRNGKR